MFPLFNKVSTRPLLKEFRTLVCMLLTCSMTLSVSLLFPLRAQASSNNASPGVATHSFSQHDRDMAAAFWTPERMKAARPIDDIIKPSIPLALAHLGSPLKQARSGYPDGPMVSRAPVPPQYPAAFTIQSSRATPISAQPVPQSTYATEHRTVGMVFSTTSEGAKLQCSGVVLASTNHSVIDTAAHCLYDPDKKTWFQNVMFCPQYFLGCPGDIWYARYTTIDFAWQFTKNAGQDFGDFAVAPNRDEITIGAAVGESGYLYNGPRYTNEDIYGYPGVLIMYTCSGTGTPAPELANNHLLPGIPCGGMGPGGSGGPWFTHNNGGVLVNGHNDKYIPSTTKGQSALIVISPYYNTEWYDNFKHAQEH